MTALSTKTAEVLAALRANTEGVETKTSDGRTFHSVYLDNARPAGMSPRAFAGHLSALAAAGLYKEVDGFAWGDVLAE